MTGSCTKAIPFSVDFPGTLNTSSDGGKTRRIAVKGKDKFSTGNKSVEAPLYV